MIHIPFLLFIGWLASINLSYAGEGYTLSSSSSLEALKKQVESLDIDLNQALKNSQTKKGIVQRRVRSKAKRAGNILTDLKLALKNYDHQNHRETLNAGTWRSFEQDVSLKIANFQEIMRELQDILIQHKEQDQTGLHPVSIKKETRSWNPAKRQRRKKIANSKALLNHHEHDDKKGPEIHYHYLHGAKPRDPEAEPFLR